MATDRVPSRLSGHLAMFSANVMWGLMAPVVKTIMIAGVITPVVMTDLRIIGACILFWILSLFTPREHVTPRDMGLMFVASLLAIVFNQGNYVMGVGMSSPVDASIITTSMPLWAMLLAAFWLKEPITLRKVAGILLGAAGALLLVFAGGDAHARARGDNPVLGDILILLAQVSYACYLVFFKNFVGRYSLVTTMKWMFTFASIVILPFSWRQMADTAWTALPATHIAGVVFVVAGATFVCYMLIIVGQRALRPTVAGMYNYVQPVVAGVVAIAWGIASPGVANIAAVVLIFAGVTLVTTSRARADAPADTDVSRH